MPRTTRGPLPAAVYWRRRLFVLGLAAAMVFLVVSLLRGGSDGRSDRIPVAQQAGNQVAPTETVTVQATDEVKRKRGKKKAVTDEPTPLAEPDGPCEPRDVVVDPVVKNAVAGQPVVIGLKLRTVESDACMWEVSGKTVTIKITDGSQEVWSTLHCRRALPDEPVVVRKAVTTLVEVEWNARLSDEGCPRLTDWAHTGDYTIIAAALGGEPSESTFDLSSPTPETVTTAPEPQNDDGETPQQDGRQDGQDRGQRPNRDEEPIR